MNFKTTGVCSDRFMALQSSFRSHEGNIFKTNTEGWQQWGAIKSMSLKMSIINLPYTTCINVSHNMMDPQNQGVMTVGKMWGQWLLSCSMMSLSYYHQPHGLNHECVCPSILVVCRHSLLRTATTVWRSVNAGTLSRPITERKRDSHKGPTRTRRRGVKVTHVCDW